MFWILQMRRGCLPIIPSWSANIVSSDCNRAVKIEHSPRPPNPQTDRVPTLFWLDFNLYSSQIFEFYLQAMERRSAFFFSPTSSMSSSGDMSHSLPKGALFSPFSPMDTSLNSSGEAQRDRENFRYNWMYQYPTLSCMQWVTVLACCLKGETCFVEPG